MTDATRTNVTITVDGRSVEASPGEMLITAAERAGTYIPRFCYHPRMEPVGVCRMCLVEVDGPRGATLQPACYLKVADGMNVTTDSDKVKKAQDGVLEFLLANHPLDCPVCDKGGECPLQDQTLAHGSGETRFIEEKRHFVKPVEIGELVLLDRERCIQCSRCTRFASEVAGEAQIAFAGRGDLIEVAPSPTQPFDSFFSGNTVQICPVGALTAKPYRFSARPWDLEQVESTCTTCAVGCRVAVQSSGNRLTRVLGVDSEPVNHGWLCDKGRFTLDAVDGHDGADDFQSARTRITQPLVRRGGVLTPVSWGEALDEAARLLREAGDAHAVGAIGGASLTNEGAFAWERFLRGVVGTQNIDAQFGDGLDPVLLQTLPLATIDEAVAAPVVLTLSGDLREELPVLFLRLREAIAHRHHALIEIASGPSAMRPLARHVLSARPGESPTIARALVSGLLPVGTLVNESDLADARALIGDGTGVVVVVGRANLAEDQRIVDEAISLLAEGLPAARFLVALRRSNVRGALDMGLSPRLRPGRGFDAAAHGRDTFAQLEAMASGAQRATVILGGCLLGNLAEQDLATAALTASRVIAVTGHGGATLAHADVVLPASVQHERAGTVTNLEGRVTAVAPKISAPGSAWPDVAIAAELALAWGEDLGLTSVEQCAQVIEETTGYAALSVLQDQSFDGVVMGREVTPVARRAMDPMAFPGIRSTKTVGLGESTGTTVLLDAATAASTATTSGATRSDVRVEKVDVPLADAYALRLVLARRLYDRGIAMQGSPALAPLIGVTTLLVHPRDLDHLGLSSGARVKVRAPGGDFEIGVVTDETVVRGTCVAALGTLDDEGVNVVSRMIDPASAVTQLRLETP
ncbi:MAG: NADH-quinone oxidoreductase subunit NuoG [Acidobacteriota bacterium]|nr:NADH-quinone oxidoreductase subunit NuoG [Acidobacteriota bacterium]